VVYDRARLQLSFWTRPGTPVLIASMFDVIVGPDDVGQTFSLSSGPMFDDIKRVLTDGVNEAILLGTDPGLPGYGGPPYSGGSGPFFSEAYLFFGDDSGAHGIDFAGSAVTSVEFRIDQLMLNTPGRNPNGDGIWTDLVLRGTLTVNGVKAEIPEPASFDVVGAALVGVLFFAKRDSLRRRLQRKTTPHYE
jgi:hypothetical protein